MSSTAAPLPPPQENHFTNTHRAIMILPVSILGVFVNFITILVMRRDKTFRNPFGYQMHIHAVCNLLECFIFATFVAGAFYWGFPSYLLHLNMRIGQIMLVLVLTSYHLCLAIAVNRFMAIGFPYTCSRFYTKRGTYIIIGISALVAFSYALIYSTESCYFVFDADAGGFMFSPTPMGDFMTAFDMRYTVTLFGLVGMFDFSTLLLLRKHRKKIQAATNEHSKQRLIQEARFFLQAMGTSLVYIVITVSYHVIYYQMTTPFGQFITTTFAWPICSTCPAIILILSNREMLNCLIKGEFLKIRLWTAPQWTTFFVSPVSK